MLSAGQDFLEGVQQGGWVDPAEVGWVGGVGVVELGHAPAGVGGDLAMDAPTIGWRGQYQRQPPGQVGIDKVGEVAGVPGQ